MKRRHGREEILSLCERLRRARPDMALGADLIAGFPTEDEAMAERTHALINEASLDFAHVFPFSARPGTPASRMRQLPGPVVRERARRLREVAAAAEASFLARQAGRTVRVLVEKSGRAGHAENFAAVALNLVAPAGSIVTARLGAVHAGRLHGDIVR